jgi:hypothetical protein
MSIMSNLKRTEKAVAKDIANGGDLARRIGDAAVAAITKGMKSKEWKQYMALFCDTKQELAQLTVERGSDHDYMPKMRAYIVANAVCAADTGTEVAALVNENIEPPAAAVVPAGTSDPKALRQELGFEIPQL